MKMEVTLTPTEVEDIVRTHLEKKFKTVGEVTLVVDKELRGQPYDEYYVTVF